MARRRQRVALHRGVDTLGMRQVAADAARVLAIASLARAAQITRQRRQHAADNQSAQYADGCELHYLPDPNRPRLCENAPHGMLVTRFSGGGRDEALRRGGGSRAVDVVSRMPG